MEYKTHGAVAGIVLIALAAASAPVKAASIIVSEFEGQPITMSPGTISVGLGVDGDAAAASKRDCGAPYLFSPGLSGCC